MDKFNFSKVGFGAKFYPVVDRNLKVIAYAAFMSLEHNPNLSSFLNQFNENTIDLFFKKLALETYKGSVPLILPNISVVNDQFPESLLKPRGYELILTVNEPEFWFNGTLNGRLANLSARGVKIAVTRFSQGFLSLPYLLNHRPKFIELAREVVDSYSDDETLKYLIKLMQPFKDMGIQVIVNGIDSKAMFERFQPLADAFQGNWITESVSR